MLDSSPPSDFSLHLLDDPEDPQDNPRPRTSAPQRRTAPAPAADGQDAHAAFHARRKEAPGYVRGMLAGEQPPAHQPPPHQRPAPDRSQPALGIAETVEDLDRSLAAARRALTSGEVTALQLAVQDVQQALRGLHAIHQRVTPHARQRLQHLIKETLRPVRAAQRRHQPEGVSAAA